MPASSSIALSLSAGAAPDRPPPSGGGRGSSRNETALDAPPVFYPATLGNVAKPMLVSVFGTPSPLTYWGIHLLRTIMQVVYGDTHYVHSIYIDDLRGAWFQRAGKNVLLVSECPESPIADLVIKSGAPIFVFADDPSDVVGYVMESRGLDVRPALSFASQSFCTLHDAFNAPAAFVVQRPRYDNRVSDLVTQILTYLEGTTPADDLVKRVLAHILPPGQGGKNPTVGDEVLRVIPGARLPGGFAAGQTAGIRNRIDGVIGQYSNIAERQPLQLIEWPRQIFQDWDRRETYSGAPIDMQGPARFLICGPTMHLPRGEWIASVEIEISENHSGNRLWADVASRDLLTAITTDLPADGVFSFEMAFEVLEPQLPIDVRFQILSGAIEGKFLMRSVSLRRAYAESPAPYFRPLTRHGIALDTAH